MIDWHVRLSLVSTFDVLSITRHHTVHHLDIQNVGGWHLHITRRRAAGTGSGTRGHAAQPCGNNGLLLKTSKDTTRQGQERDGCHL